MNKRLGKCITKEKIGLDVYESTWSIEVLRVDSSSKVGN